MPFFDTSDHVAFDEAKLRKHNLFDEAQLTGDVYCLCPGQAQKPHRHDGQAKFYFVISGRGRFTLADESRDLGPGGLACAPEGVEHGVVNPGPENLVLLVAIAPSPNKTRNAEVGTRNG